MVESSFMQGILTLILTVMIACPQVMCRAAAADTPTPDERASAKPAAKLSDLFPDTVVAKGKSVEVKRSQLEEAMTGLKSSFAARGQALSAEEAARAEAQVLQRLIQIQLLLAKATDGDRAEGKETTTKRLEAIKTRAGSD